jgi:hypothetical protein
VVNRVLGYESRAGGLDFGALCDPWRTDTVVALARRMYDTNDFGEMPTLADARQGAGRDDEESPKPLPRHGRRVRARVLGCRSGVGNE